MTDKPKKSLENGLTKIFDHWAGKFAALNAEADRSIAASKASGDRVDKNMERRRIAFEQ